MEIKEPVVLLNYKKFIDKSECHSRKQKRADEYWNHSTDSGRRSIISDRTFSIIWNKLKYEVTDDTWYSKFRSIVKKQKSSLEEDTTLQRSARDGKRLIFDNLSGVVSSGEIVAIMGPSGAGKTSLLNILSGRLEDYQGKKYLLSASGEKVDLTMAFVPQKDHLNDFMTVEESFIASSMFKNALDKYDHKKKSCEVAKYLNLIDCFDTRCGSLSGGEYKRTCIGQELISDPDLLVLDEPTSGLDSYAAKKLMMNLKQLIKHRDKPMAIIVTIHQPSDDVFHLFDRVYIMGLQGQVIYDGPPENALKVIKSLSIDTSSTCKSHDKTSSARRVHARSLASFLLELASDFHGLHATNILSQYQRQQYQSKLNQLGLANSNDNDIVRSTEHIQNSSNTQNDISVGNKEDHNQLNELVIANSISGNFWHTVKILSKLELKTLLRNNPLLIAIFIFYTSTLLGVSITFPRMTNNRTSCPIVMREIPIASIMDKEWGLRQSIEDRAEEVTLVLENLRSQIILCSFYGWAAGSFSVFSLHLRIHTAIREVTNGWYKYSALVIAIFINTIVRDSVLPMLGVIAAYKLCDNLTSYLEWRMIMVSLVTGLFSVTYSLIGLLSGALFLDSFPTSIFFVTLTLLPQILCVNIIVPISMNPVIKHISWLSLNQAVSGLITLIRFGFGLCKCDQNLQLYMNQTKQASFIGLSSRAEKSFGNLLSNGTSLLSSGDNSNSLATSNNNIFSNLANLMIKFLNYGETIDHCNQFTAYVLKFTKLDESQAIHMLMVMIIWFILASVLMIVAMRHAIKRKSYG